MKQVKIFHGLGPFLLLWSTQALSSLGSAMTSFGLVIWSYQQHGSALTTALLSVCTYAPYVLLSIFAGVISDRWDKRRIMLVCDTLGRRCHTYGMGAAAYRAAGGMAPVSAQRGQRPDECSAAACLRGGGESADSERAVSAGRRPARAVRFAGDGIDPAARDRHYCIWRGWMR